MKAFERRYEDLSVVGFYHKVVFVLCCVCYLACGCYYILLPFLTKQIQLDLNLTFLKVSLLQSSSNVGGLIGGLANTVMLNALGRKTMLCLSTFLGAMSGVFFYSTDTINEALIGYFLIGVYMSWIGNSVIIYVVELFPQKSRAKLIVFLLSFFSVGRVFGSFLLWATLNNYEDGMWILPLIITGTMLAFVFPGMLLFLRESVKYSFMKRHFGQLEDDFRDIQEMNLEHNRPSNLEKVFRETELRKLASLDQEIQAEISRTSNGLEELKKTSSLIEDEKGVLRMAFFFFLTKLLSGCLADGHVMAISNTMGTDSGVLIQTIGIMTGEFIAVIITGAFIEHPRVGRYRLIFANFLVAALIFLMPLFTGFENLFWCFYLSKVSLKIVYSTTSIHIAESLPVKTRDRYLPIIATACEISESVYPLIFFETVKWGRSYVFGGLSVMCILGFFASRCMNDDLEDKRKAELNKGERS